MPGSNPTLKQDLRLFQERAKRLRTSCILKPVLLIILIRGVGKNMQHMFDGMTRKGACDTFSIGIGNG
ncbi:hypothetical protein [Pontibacter rugosus]